MAPDGYACELRMTPDGYACERRMTLEACVRNA